jgi:hypothetical protein
MRVSLVSILLLLHDIFVTLARPDPPLTDNDGSGAPNLNLSAKEKQVYGQLFRQADSDNVGVVTGEVAVKFFEKTRLDSRILGEVSLRSSLRKDSLGRGNRS